MRIAAPFLFLLLARQATAAEPPPGSRWAVTAGGGAAALFSAPGEPTLTWNAAGQIEIHRAVLAPLFLGAALDLGPRHVHPMGAAVLGGVEARGKLGVVAASMGVGVEAFRTFLFAPGGFFITDLTPVAYSRGAVMAGVPVAASVEVVTEVVGHLAATQRGGAAFVSGTVGVRVTLP